jgi:transcription termination factor Rho
MSVGQDFDPSLLEGKDRAELVAIATSLGKKPPARAKKETVIALIMELVGADPSGGGSGDAAADADDAPGAAGSTPDAKGDTPDADASDDSGQDDQDRGSGNGDGGGDSGSEDGADQSDQTDQGNQNDQGEQGQPGGGGGEDLEPGNRRRRRRGRDRDRRPEGDDQPVEPVEVEGLVDLREEGYGFLRLHGYLPSRDDAYISVKQTRQFGLRTGDVVKGKARPANRNEKNPALLQVERVNSHPSHQQPARRRFEDLTALFPDERLRLATDDPANTVGRAIDDAAPLGKGQRTLIVAPPRSGRSRAVQQIARAAVANHDDVEVMVLLIDERPEEVVEMQRALPDIQVAASSFDHPAEEHVSVAELAVERAKRLVESGRDVVLVVDGLTRLARAYNQAGQGSGRQVGGVIDTSALFQAKRLFGAARKAEEGGSLTILATALVDTGAHIDQVIFEEIADTPNSVVRLQQLGADGTGAPVVDAGGSSTDHAVTPTNS